MKAKLLFILIVLVLLTGCQTKAPEVTNSDSDYGKDTGAEVEKEVNNEESEYYDDLDSAATELDELDDL